MIRRIRSTRAILRAIVYCLPVVAFLIASYERFGILVIRPNYASGSYFYLLLFTILIWPFLADRHQLSSFDILYTENTAIVRSMFACGVLCVVDSTLLLFCRQLVVSRVFLVGAVLGLFVLSVITRFVFRTLVLPGKARLRAHTKVLVVGADKHAHWAAIRLNSAPLVDCKVSAFIALPDQCVKVKGAPVLPLEQIDSIKELDIESIFIAVGPERYSEVADVYELLKKLGKPIYAILDFGSKISIREKFFQIGRLQVINLEPSATEGFGYSVLKRIFDVSFSAATLAILSPLFAVVALLVRISSPGPIFFRQLRVGLNGKEFDMYKFRTMHCTDERESDKCWTKKDDPRRTAIGAFLRRTSLDELPQLLNVIKGDMSLVGPRPERPHFVSMFKKEIDTYDLRHRAKVGITGWAQVNGLRGDTSIRRRLNYDVYYLQHWSFTFDLRILFLTFRSMLFDRNAY